MEKEQISLAMVIIIMVITKMESHMVKEFIHGKMEVNMMESLMKVLNMERVFGKRIRMILQDIDTKETIKTIGSMAMGNSIGNQAIFIKEIT